MSRQKQESKTMSLGAKVTPSEYYAITWLVGRRGTDVSSLIRELVVEPMMREHAKLSEADSKAEALSR